MNKLDEKAYALPSSPPPFAISVHAQPLLPLPISRDGVVRILPKSKK
jgi:hypothetical protein